MRLVGRRGRLNDPRVKCDLSDQGEFRRVGNDGDIRPLE